MTKRFYIDVEVPPFNGKLSIDIDAGSEKQAWENVHRMLERKVYQLKTTHVRLICRGRGRQAMTENHVESCYCWVCGGYGKVEGEVAIPDPIRGGYLQEVMVECEECEGSGENKRRTKATQTAVIRSFLTATKQSKQNTHSKTSR